MEFFEHYLSPVGKLLMASDRERLTGLWFEGQKYFPYDICGDFSEKELPIFKMTRKWLDGYFSGKKPELDIPLGVCGTEFQNEVWDILRAIPYGNTVTYKDIAEIIAKKHGIKQMSAQAVGGAVGKNRISIIIPCHRVIGRSGALTGYAGGTEKKLYLLKLEGALI